MIVPGLRMIRLRHVEVQGIVAMRPAGRAHAIHCNGRYIWAECRGAGRYRADLSNDGVEWATVTTSTAKFLELGDCLNCHRDKRADAIEVV